MLFLRRSFGRSPRRIHPDGAHQPTYTFQPYELQSSRKPVCNADAYKIHPAYACSVSVTIHLVKFFYRHREGIFSSGNSDKSASRLPRCFFCFGLSRLLFLSLILSIVSSESASASLNSDSCPPGLHPVFPRGVQSAVGFQQYVSAR